MAQFKTTLINQTKQNPFVTAYAVYEGPNAPQVPEGLGTPVEWTPPPAGSPPGALGTLNAPMLAEPSTPGGAPTTVTVAVPMSQEDAQAFGNILGVATYPNQSAGISFYTGGILAVSYEGQWAGPGALYNNLPNSENVGNAFVNFVNWMATNPFYANEAGGGWIAAGFTIFVAGEIVTGGGAGAVIAGLAALAWLLSTTKAGQSGTANFMAYPGDDYPDPYGSAPIDPDWCDGNTFTDGQDGGNGEHFEIDLIDMQY